MSKRCLLLTCLRTILHQFNPNPLLSLLGGAELVRHWHGVLGPRAPAHLPNLPATGRMTGHLDSEIKTHQSWALCPLSDEQSTAHLLGVWSPCVNCTKKTNPSLLSSSLLCIYGACKPAYTSIPSSAQQLFPGRPFTQHVHRLVPASAAAPPCPMHTARATAGPTAVYPGGETAGQRAGPPLLIAEI